MFETKDGIIKPIVYVGILKGDRLLLVNYKYAPNPTKPGWWIPAPELAFGEDPAGKAATVLSDFGFSESKPKLQGVESFVTPGGWHLIYHYVCKVSTEMRSHETIISHKWVTSEELENMRDVAHGKWEIGIGKSYLQSSLRS